MTDPKRTVTVEPVNPSSPSLGPFPRAFKNSVCPCSSKTKMQDSRSIALLAPDDRAPAPCHEQQKQSARRHTPRHSRSGPEAVNEAALAPVLPAADGCRDRILP